MRWNLIKNQYLVKANRILSKFLLLNKKETMAVEKLVKPALSYYIEIKCYRTINGEKYNEI